MKIRKVTSASYSLLIFENVQPYELFDSVHSSILLHYINQCMQNVKS